MISRCTFAVAAALSLCAVAPPAASQTPPPPVTPQSPQTPGRPPLVNIQPPKPAPPKTTLDRYKGRVLSFNMAQIIVQSADNEKMIWSFQYSPELRQKVADMLSSGGYQYGDKIRVYCNPGTMVAVKFKGKPSKSS